MVLPVVPVPLVVPVVPVVEDVPVVEPVPVVPVVVPVVELDDVELEFVVADEPDLPNCNVITRTWAEPPLSGAANFNFLPPTVISVASALPVLIVTVFVVLGNEMVCELPPVSDACHTAVPSVETEVQALLVPVAEIFNGVLPDVPLTW